MISREITLILQTRSMLSMVCEPHIFVSNQFYSVEPGSLVLNECYI